MRYWLPVQLALQQVHVRERYDVPDGPAAFGRVSTRPPAGNDPTPTGCVLDCVGSSLPRLLSQPRAEFKRCDIRFIQERHRAGVTRFPVHFSATGATVRLRLPLSFAPTLHQFTHLSAVNAARIFPRARSGRPAITRIARPLEILDFLDARD